MIGVIEAGGTKFICALYDENHVLQKKKSIPTTNPLETLKHVFDFFETADVSKLGIACFGPIDVNKKSVTYGHITNTPKLLWQNFNIVQTISERLDCPIAFDTDVNGAALAESLYGSAKDVDSCLYLTIGTGIGGGATINGQLIHGLLHPEMGHIRIPRLPGDTFKGICPFHNDCLEGLVSGPALAARSHLSADQLSTTDPLWDTTAYYIAQALVNYILILSPEKIILGGGVMQQTQLFPLIHDYVLTLLNNYIHVPALTKESIADYIIPPALGSDVGILGALALTELITY